MANNDDTNPNNEISSPGITYPTPYIPDPESIRIPSDFTIEAVKLYPWNGATPIDLTNVRGTINIFEDIFNNFLTGNITVADAWDLPMLYPLIGEEFLEISFKRPGTKNQGTSNAAESPDYRYGFEEQIRYLVETESFVMKFRVIKMTDRKLVRDRAQSYTLHFTSEEFISNKKNKFRKSYIDTLYSDMVKDVYDTFLNKGKPIVIESTMYEQDFVFSNWTPSQCVNIVAARSIANGRSGSNYVFFETVAGFNFVSLEKLFEAKEKETLLYQPANIMITPPNRPIDEEVRNIYEFDYVDYFDVVSNLQHGMYAAKLLTVDPIRRIYEEYDFDYAKEFDRFKHLEKNKVCTDGLDAMGEPYMARFDLLMTNKDHDKVDWIVSREPGIKPTQLEFYVLQRQSQMQQLNNVRIAVTVPGNTERHAGDVIAFALPNAMGSPIMWDEPEKYLSGRYLISAIRHRIEANGYHQDIELVKDSFLSKIEYIDPIPIYLPTW